MPMEERNFANPELIHSVTNADKCEMSRKSALLPFLIIMAAFVQSSDLKAEATLQPDEKLSVVTKSEATVTVSDDEPASLIRCEKIPDEALEDLNAFKPGSKTVTKVEWQRRAAEFVARYGNWCPNFSAFKRKLPSWLLQDRYLDMFATLFDLNRERHAGRLLRLARADEVGQRERSRDPAVLQKMADDHAKVLRQASAAKYLLDVKFSEEIKGRRKANTIVKRFLAEYLDGHGNVRTKKIPALRKELSDLDAQQKTLAKSYLQDILKRREYPRTHFLPTKAEEAARAKEKRGPASFTPREAAYYAAIYVMLFQLE
jgi:hypothetical protein